MKKKAVSKGADKAASTEFPSRPKNFGYGNDFKPKSGALSRCVRWPRYIRIQRQKKVLLNRLKVPPAINLFSNTADRAFASSLFKFCDTYRPETRKERKARRKQVAAAKAEGKEVEAGKPDTVLKFGLNHVTQLVEQKRAKLVLIANDVDPIEIVVWLPTLCYKMGVPFVIVKGRARLGTLVGMKNATCVAVTDIRAADDKKFSSLVDKAQKNYLDRFEEFRKTKGGSSLGPKAQAKKDREDRIARRNEREVKKIEGKD